MLGTVSLLLAVAALFVSSASCLIAAGTARRLNRMRPRSMTFPSPEGIPNGSPLPEALLDRLPLDRLGDRWLLVVGSEGCPACRNLAGRINERANLFEGLPVVVLDESPSGTLARSLQLEALTVPDDGGLFQAMLKVVAIPHSFVIERGRVAAQSVGDNLDGLLGAVESAALITSQ